MNSASRQRIAFLYAFIRPYRGRMLAIVAMTGVCTLFSLAPPLAIRFLVDRVITPGRWSLAWLGVMLVAVLPLWNHLLGALQRWMIAAVAQRFVAEMRTAFFRHVLGLSLRYHGEAGSGALMNRIMGDVSIVQNLLTYETLSVLTNLISLAFALSMTFLISWKIALLMLPTCALYIANHFLFTRRIRRANQRIREASDQVSRRLHERIAGVKLVKIYSREEYENAAFLGATDQALEYGLRGEMLHATFSGSASLISGIGQSATSLCLIASVIAQRISLGDMFAFEQYVGRVIGPCFQLTLVSGTINQAIASLDRIIEVFSVDPEIRDRPGARDLAAPKGELLLDRVTFAYRPDRPLLQEFSLHIPAGRMTALVGHTGCGKTTVTSLLLRLWDVQGGRVLFDGRDLRDITLRSLRRAVAAVPQESVVFEGTVFDNIAYGDPDASYAAVEAAARVAGLHDWIAAQPDGYRAWVGKKGSTFSAGQRQCLAIARAVCRNPAVLILDEATSALDSASEAAIQRAVAAALQGRTSVVVAHRLSTIIQADQIVVMDHGRIVETGRHADLVRIPDGRYRRLYEELKHRHEQHAHIA